MNYNFLPKSNMFRQITTGVSWQDYHTGYNEYAMDRVSFHKRTAQINLFFNKSKARSFVSSQLTLKGVSVVETYFYGPYYSQSSTSSDYIEVSDAKSFGQLSYTMQNSKTLNPFGVNAVAEFTNDFAKLSAEANFQFDFKKSGKEVKIRLFGGSFLFNETNSARYNYRMDGIRGYNDYTYDHVYFGRNEFSGVLSQQMAMGYGGFKIPTAVGQSNSWLVAMNVKAGIPIGLPLGVFLDVGYGYNTSANINYDFGIHVPLIDDVFEIYFPVFWSQDIQSAIDANGTTYGQLIRFTLHVEKINPFQLLRDFEF